MKQTTVAIFMSMAVHCCVIPLLVAASFVVESKPVKVVEVDFSLIRGQESHHPAPEVKGEIIRRRLQVSGGGGVSGTKAQPRHHAPRNPEALPVKEKMEPPPSPTIVSPSDGHGETVIHGVAATYADSSGAINGLQSHGDGNAAPGAGHGGGYGGGSGGGQGPGYGAGQGTGKGVLDGGKDYSYIRDAILKNVRYPDEAIRSGIEGRVVLSFVVLENGTTSNITVVSSSGYRLLDDSATEAVAKTRIQRKVPYRVVVHLPVTYKLRG